MVENRTKLQQEVVDALLESSAINFEALGGIIAKFGGKVMARGGRHQIMEGPDKFHRFVVIEFPTFEQGVACFTSPEYDRAAAFRRKGAGEVETVIVEGGDPSR